MSNETLAAPDRTVFVAVFNQNWDNARHIKAERISFMNAYSVICAGVLALLQSVQASDLIRIALLFFMTLFSLIGLLTSLRLKGELEECLAKIARAIGLRKEAQMWEQRAQAIVDKITAEMWDAEAGLFWAKRNGQTIRIRTPKMPTK